MKVAILTMCLCCSVAAAAEPEPFVFPRSTPETQGIASSAILDFVDTADREIAEMHSFMLVRHGHVVAEGWWTPYDASTRHQLYSLSKSFTSTAAGLAITDGKFALDDRVVSFFPDETPDEVSENLRAMRIRDLLTMSTGHQTQPNVSSSSQPWTTVFLNHPVPHEPGTHFLYNTPATYMVSAIVQKQTGQTVLDYLQPRLFEPLGIEDPQWDSSPQEITLGGYGLSVRTEDIARLGQLYLQKGNWNGKQLLPASWVAEATAKQVSNGTASNSDWNQGYGFQFWRCRHGCYRGDGAFGQYCIVLPEQDSVVAITSGVKNMQAVMNLVWSKLLPALQENPLPNATVANTELKRKLAALKLPMPEGEASAPIAKEVSGKQYAFPENDQKMERIGIECNRDGAVMNLIVRSEGIDYRVPCGTDGWEKGRLKLASFPERVVALNSAWTDPDTLTVKLCICETPHCLTLRLKFSGDQLQLDSEMNVAFGPTKRPQLIGRLIE